MTERSFNLVVPLAHKATAMRITETASRGAYLEVYVAHQLGIAVVDASIFDGTAVQCEAA